MNIIIAKGKDIGVYIDMPNEEQVNEIFQKISGYVFSLKSNKRCETFSWHSFMVAVYKERKRLTSLKLKLFW